MSEVSSMDWKLGNKLVGDNRGFYVKKNLSQAVGKEFHRLGIIPCLVTVSV